MVSKELERKSVKQAAVEVLAKAGEPLKSAEITRRVLEVKGVEPSQVFHVPLVGPGSGLHVPFLGPGPWTRHRVLNFAFRDAFGTIRPQAAPGQSASVWRGRRGRSPGPRGFGAPECQRSFKNSSRPTPDASMI